MTSGTVQVNACGSSLLNLGEGEGGGGGGGPNKTDHV